MYFERCLFIFIAVAISIFFRNDTLVWLFISDIFFCIHLSIDEPES